MTSANDVVNRWVSFNEEGRTKRFSDHLTAGSLRFEGPMLISYRTPIARYWKGFVLVTNKKYSPSTSRHLYLARNGPGFPVFEVPDINTTEGSNFVALCTVFANALAAYRKKYLQTRGSGWQYNEMIGGVLTAYSQLKKYHRLTGCEGVVPDYKALIAEADRHRQQKLDHYNSPKEVEKRERSRARKEAAEAFDLPTEKET